MSRIRWVGLASGVISPSIPVDAQNELTRASNWHVFVSGTAGGATVTLGYSPDTIDTSDANSTWFTPTALTAMAIGDTFFLARPRKYRVTVNGGNGTTSLTVEVRA
jgi:hypothetical protein